MEPSKMQTHFAAFQLTSLTIQQEAYEEFMKGSA